MAFGCPRATRTSTSRMPPCSCPHSTIQRTASPWAFSRSVSPIAPSSASTPWTSFGASAQFIVSLNKNLLELPNLHTIPGENGNQQAIPLRVIANVRRARYAFDDRGALPVLIAMDRGVGPARHNDGAVHDFDAVELPRTRAECRHVFVAGLPSHERVPPERYHDEALVGRIPRDAVRPAQRFVRDRYGDFVIGRDAEDPVCADVLGALRAELDRRVGDVQ